MPSYAFKCACGYTTVKIFKSLPSDAKRSSAPCDECDKSMERDIAAEGFFAVGGTNFGVQKDAAFAMQKVNTGGQMTPIYTDENGQTHEVRNSKDIDTWTASNQLGKPRMVKWMNPVTGVSEMVPQRTVMKADPVTGEVEDRGAVIRGTEKLVPLDKSSFNMPTETSTGIPLKNGVMDKRRQVVTHIDPFTGKPKTIREAWVKSPDGFNGKGRSSEFRTKGIL